MARFFELFCLTVDRIAGLLIAAVTVLVVASAAGRYIFTTPIPDAFDISRLMIGACVIWGFAAVGYRGGHISVDVFVEMMGVRARRIVDIIAWSVVLLFVVLLCWKMFGRVNSAFASGETTFDLRLPIWPFLGVIWAGTAASIVTVSVRIVLLMTGRISFELTETERLAHGER